MKTSVLGVFGGATLLLLLAACATPEARIKKNADLFASFPPDVQAAVREGIVRPGFSKDAAYIARGEPDRTYTRITASGTNEIWSYVATQTWRDRERVRADFHVRDGDGRTRRVSDTVWVDVDHEREYERFRIEFTNNFITAIESLRQP